MEKKVYQVEMTFKEMQIVTASLQERYERIRRECADMATDFTYSSDEICERLKYSDDVRACQAKIVDVIKSICK